MITLLILLTVVAQDPQTVLPGRSDVQRRMSSLQPASGLLDAEVDVVMGALQKGQFDYVANSKDEKLEAAIVTWVASRPRWSGMTKGRLGGGTAPTGTTTGSYSGPEFQKMVLTVSQDYSRVAASLGRIVIVSEPTGAAVSIDGYRWQRPTNAEGFAEVGSRKVVLSKDGGQLGVTCVIRKGGTVNLNADFRNGKVSCQ